MQRLLLDKRLQFRTQSFLGHQINRATQQVFQKELHTEVALRCCRPVKSHQYVHIAIRSGMVPGSRTKERQPYNTESPRQYRLVAG